jgi:hypothetical protein
LAKPFDIRIDKASLNFLKKIQANNDPRRREQLLRPGVQRIATRTAAHIARTELTGQSLKVRSGQLKRSIVGIAAFGPTGLPGIEVGILQGPLVPILTAHEYGTTIRPVKAKALAQPFGKRALTRAGVSRYDSPRSYPGVLKFIPYQKAKRKKSPVIGGLYDEDDLDRLADSGDAFDLFDIEPVFLLRTHTVLKERAPLEKGMESRLSTIGTEFSELITRLFQ